MMPGEATAWETVQAMLALMALPFRAVGPWMAAASPERMVFTGDGMAFVHTGQVDPLRARHPP
ncbi:MAG TPA: hypothetical protein VFS20_10835 [Longimicrobium sp.]|nr:hypothetical protein [Longimicrobium sp.]